MTSARSAAASDVFSAFLCVACLLPEGMVVGQVMREFRLPEGMSAADLDAASDPQSGLLVVLDLRGDDSLQAAGLAREVCHKQLGEMATQLASSVVTG